MHRFLPAAVIPILLLSTLVARGEKASMPPDALTKVATHIVRGEIKAIYTRTERDGQWKVTRYVAEVKLEKVEKGEGLAAGGLVYVRYWTRSWTGFGAPPPSTSGHRGLPKAGETLRIYLARNAYDGFTKENNDGGFNVIGANGFERKE
jgi:hypothetical protein